MSNKNMIALRDAIATASMAYAGCAAADDDDSMKCTLHEVHLSSKGVCLKMLSHANNVLLNVLESIDLASHKVEGTKTHYREIISSTGEEYTI